MKIKFLFTILLFLIFGCSQNNDNNLVDNESQQEKWEAKIYVFVHDSRNNPIEGAVVYGGWYLDEAAVSARTASDGYALFSKTTSEKEVDFDIRKVSAQGYDTLNGYPIYIASVDSNNPTTTVSIELK